MIWDHPQTWIAKSNSSSSVSCSCQDSEHAPRLDGIHKKMRCTSLGVGLRGSGSGTWKDGIESESLTWASRNLGVKESKIERRP